jgi:hypothetical protein
MTCKNCTGTGLYYIPLTFVPGHVKISRLTLCKTNHVFIQPVSTLYKEGRIVFGETITYLDPLHKMYNGHVFCSKDCMLAHVEKNYTNRLFRNSSSILQKSFF